jgi:hypothetical protein
MENSSSLLEKYSEDFKLDKGCKASAEELFK